MGLLEDMNTLLDRIPIWKRLQDVPEEIDDLSKRVALIEEKLGNKWPPDVCRYCGERAARLDSQIGPNRLLMMTEFWKCEKCEETETRQVKPT